MKILYPDLLKKCIVEEKNPKIKIKLLCLNAVSNGVKVREVASTFDVPKRTISDWKKYWNDNQYQGLVPTKQPGRPSRLKPEQFEELKKLLITKQIFTTKDVRMLIQEKYGVLFSMNYVERILREKFKFTHKKPYIIPSKRPENAEEILEERLKATINHLKQNPNFDVRKLAIGFIDESSCQNNSNSVKLWSSIKNPKLVKNPEKLKANTIGYYSIIGNSTEEIIEDSTKETLSKFLTKIRDKNTEFENIIVILDNYKSHHSNLFISKANSLNISLVFLPPYSPDLNPIEYIWKSVKRILSEKNL
jgi:transposase